MTSQPRAMKGAAARGLAGAIAREAGGAGAGFFTLHTFAPSDASAPWETFGAVHSAFGPRPLFFVSDHGVMRTASVLVVGPHPRDDRFESPKGPLLAPDLGALVARSAQALAARSAVPTVLDAAVAVMDAVRPLRADVRCTILGRWEGTLGARFDAGAVGPLCFVWQRSAALTLALAARAAGKLVVPSVEEPLPDLGSLADRAREAARAIVLARG
jgi:hypothetical protein